MSNIWKTYKEIDKNELGVILKNTPQEVVITEVTDMIENEFKEGSYFFYIMFSIKEFDTPVKVSYPCKFNSNDELLIGLDSKLYPIASYVSGISNEPIKVDFDAFRKELANKSFKATATVKKIGSNSYYVIKPLKQ